MPQTPYRLARLVESKDHPWYIVFYVWDAQKAKLVRKKDYDVSKLNGISLRRNFAKKRIADINKMLLDGYHIDRQKHSDDKAKTINFRREYSVADAFKTALMLTKSTKRPATYNSYSSVAGIFVDFCRAHGWEKWPIKSLTKKGYPFLFGLCPGKGLQQYHTQQVRWIYKGDDGADGRAWHAGNQPGKRHQA